MFPFKLVHTKPPITGGKPCYYATSIVQGNLTGDALLEALSQRCKLSETDCLRLLYSLSDIMAENLKKGNSVTLPNLGTFRATLKSRSVTEEGDFKHSHIQGLNINLHVHKNLRKKLKDVEFREIKKRGG